MKKTILPLLATMLLFATGCQESLEDRCAREASEYTQKHCPTLITKDIVLDSMTFERQSHTICYVYTVNGIIDDPEVIQRGDPHERLLHQIKNSPNLKLYKDAGYSFRYTYFSTKNKGVQLYSATFHEKDYK